MHASLQQHPAAPACSQPPLGYGLRRRLVDTCFRRLLDKVDGQLCLPGQLPTRGIHRILVCRPNHRLGNTLLISPLLAEIEAMYPGAEVDIVSGGHAGEDLFAHRFQVRRCYSLPRKIARHLHTTTRLLRELRSDAYDLAIDTCIDSQSARLLLALTRARFKLGYPREGHPAALAWHGLPRPEQMAQRSVFLLRTAHAGQVSRPYPPLGLQLQDSELGHARRALETILAGTAPAPSAARSVVGIFPHATGAKRYGVDWWARFTDALLAIRPDTQIVNLVAEHGQSQLDERYASYYTRNLRHLAAMIACMDAFISADCGVMHLAAAAGTPTLGLFSNTSPAKYGPDGAKHATIETHAMTAGDVAAIAADWLALAADARGDAGSAAARYPA